jgi:hypothetical protein
MSSRFREQEENWLSSGGQSVGIETVLIDIGSGRGAGVKHAAKGNFSKIVLIEPNSEACSALGDIVHQYGLGKKTKIINKRFPFDGWAEDLETICGGKPYVLSVHWCLLQNHPKDYLPFVEIASRALRASFIINDLSDSSLINLPGMTGRNLPQAGDPRARLYLADKHKDTYHVCETEYLFHPAHLIDPLRAKKVNVAMYKVLDSLNSPAIPSHSATVVGSLRAIRVGSLGLTLNPAGSTPNTKRCAVPSSLIKFAYPGVELKVKKPKIEDAEVPTVDLEHTGLETGEVVKHGHKCVECGVVFVHSHRVKALTSYANGVLFSNRCDFHTLNYSKSVPGQESQALRRSVFADPRVLRLVKDSDLYWEAVSDVLALKKQTNVKYSELVRDRFGVASVPNAFSPLECAELLSAFRGLPYKREGKRKVYETGQYTYGPATADHNSWVTEFASEVLARLRVYDEVTEVRVVDYDDPRGGSGRHIDLPRLGSTVFALSLSSYGVIRFTDADKRTMCNVPAGAGDVYSFSGVSRYVWSHEYSPRFSERSTGGRVVITIRTDSEPQLAHMLVGGVHPTSKKVYVKCIEVNKSDTCDQLILVDGKYAGDTWKCKSCQLFHRKAFSQVVVDVGDDVDDDALNYDGFYSPDEAETDELFLWDVSLLGACVEKWEEVPLPAIGSVTLSSSPPAPQHVEIEMSPAPDH